MVGQNVKMSFFFLFQFLQQFRHYESNLQVFKLDPSNANKTLGDLVMFISQVWLQSIHGMINKRININNWLNTLYLVNGKEKCWGINVSFLTDAVNCTGTCNVPVMRILGVWCLHWCWLFCLKRSDDYFLLLWYCFH